MICRSGPWGVEAIERHLRDMVIPVRIATMGASGPLVQSLWFVYADDALWCATQADAVIVRRLVADPRCGFEVAPDEPPYRGGRGNGRATIVPEAAGEILPTLIARYLGPTPTGLGEGLMSRIDSEVAVRIDDLAVSSWDFSARM